MSKSILEQALGFDIPAVVPVMLIVYIVAILLVGLWAAKKVKNSEDWFVGGRSMGPWITALAHGSSSLGGGMYIAGPQYGWEAGASFVRAADEAIRHATFEIEVAFCYIDRIGFDAHAFKCHRKREDLASTVQNTLLKLRFDE